MAVKTNKTDRLQVRLTPEQKEELKRLAAAEGRSMSDYVEMLIDHAIAEDFRMYEKAKAEVMEKCPDISDIERELLIHEQVALRKAARNRLDGLLIYRRNRMAQHNPPEVSRALQYSEGDMMKRMLEDIGTDGIVLTLDKREG